MKPGTLITRNGYTLRHAATREPVKVGDTLTDHRGDTATAKTGTPPHKSGDSGTVTTSTGEYPAAVFDLKWIADNRRI